MIAASCLLAITASAQSNFTEDEKLKKLVEQQVRKNKLTNSMPGYRIQIYFGSTRNKALEIKTSFEQQFPDINSYLIYDAPNFKVRVGDYQTRWLALPVLEKLRNNFEIAFIVKDEIPLTKTP